MTSFQTKAEAGHNARPPQCCVCDTALISCWRSCRTSFVGTDCESLASSQTAKLALFIAPPLPTEHTSLGFGGASVPQDSAEGFGSVQLLSNRDYWRSCRTPWGTWLAWASMAWADWIRMLFLV